MGVIMSEIAMEQIMEKQNNQIPPDDDDLFIRFSLYNTLNPWILNIKDVSIAYYPTRKDVVEAREDFLLFCDDINKISKDEIKIFADKFNGKNKINKKNEKNIIDESSDKDYKYISRRALKGTKDPTKKYGHTISFSRGSYKFVFGYTSNEEEAIKIRDNFVKFFGGLEKLKKISPEEAFVLYKQYLPNKRIFRKHY